MGRKRLTKRCQKKRDNNNRNDNDNMECDDVIEGCSVIFSNKARQTTKEHTLHNRFAHTPKSLTYTGNVSVSRATEKNKCDIFIRLQ